MNKRINQHIDIVLLGASYLLLDDLNVDIINVLPKKEAGQRNIWIHKIQIPSKLSPFILVNIRDHIRGRVGERKKAELLVGVMGEKETEKYWEEITSFLNDECIKLMLVTEEEVRKGGKKAICDLLKLLFKEQVSKLKRRPGSGKRPSYTNKIFSNKEKVI
ncbi:MAG: hypothetical protein V1712_01345 [Patescibacteria group bacterium]